ncbi:MULTISPECIES: hypothetical protein [Bradyrhizobium]|uniref:hypothetical protein n=1 Tax=Bradyrhizobium TaxID=374 RepID=UPI001BAAB1ED|nr:hypothetical protein [Bradyrhizobium liaoningense]MBR0986822.1 hypothetical protein [Bradyrhizobium liaoningense]GMO98366.1 hypothetical protein TM239_18190 [Bradyrhizobium sp. TM239]
MISEFFNHTGPRAPGTPAGLSDSKADFFARRLSVNHDARAQSGAHRGSDLMTFAGKLSVVTAYLAMAFVGAIVLGMI